MAPRLLQRDAPATPAVAQNDHQGMFLHGTTENLLTYTDYELASYYSETGLARLRHHVDVVMNNTGRVLQGRELAEAAAGCEIILAHRSSAGHKETFDHSPDLIAFVRAAVDISTVDLPAADAYGILVTHTSAGFGTAVSEMALAMMLDLARGISLARSSYAANTEPVCRKACKSAAPQLASSVMEP